MPEWRIYAKLLIPIICVCGVVIYIAYGYIATKKSQGVPVIIDTAIESTHSADKKNPQLIYVDVSGAVVSPGLYTLPVGARLADALQMAGGISKSASALYVSQEINLSYKLKDGDKIYIPFVSDADSMQYLSADLKLLCQDSSSASGANESSHSAKIDVNSASRDDLIALPGIGESTADKIIAGRPYSSLDEFYSKIKLTTATKDKLKNLLEAR